MKKKMIAVLLAALFAFSALGATAFAQTDVDLDTQTDGRLTITEPGSYVLTGRLTGCVYVDPGKGEVELVLDGADIDGRTGAGIVAVSGERLTVRLPEGSVNRVKDGGRDESFNAAIYSKVPMRFEGEGALYVTGRNQDGIRAEKAALTFNGGSYAIKAPENGIGAKTLTINDGHFSIQAENSVDPSAKLVMNGGEIEEVPQTDAAAAANQQPPEMPPMPGEGP